MDRDEMTATRKTMVDEITAEVMETRKWLGKDALDPRVTAALEDHCPNEMGLGRDL